MKSRWWTYLYAIRVVFNDGEELTLQAINGRIPTWECLDEARAECQRLKRRCRSPNVTAYKPMRIR